MDDYRLEAIIDYNDERRSMSKIERELEHYTALHTLQNADIEELALWPDGKVTLVGKGDHGYTPIYKADILRLASPPPPEPMNQGDGAYYYCDELMRGAGWTVIKLSQRGGSRVRKSHITAGVPDRKYYRGSDTFWFESKQEDRGLQSEEQKVFQSMCERAGELYVIGGQKELTAFLKQWGEKVRRRA